MVTSKVALNYHLNPDGIAQFFQKYGNNFESNVLDPGLQEILKAVTARYTAEEVITKREQVREDTIALLRERFLPQGMVIDGSNIIDFHFSKVFNDATEAKVTADLVRPFGQPCKRSDSCACVSIWLIHPTPW